MLQSDTISIKVSLFFHDMALLQSVLSHWSPGTLVVVSVSLHKLASSVNNTSNYHKHVNLTCSCPYYKHICQ